MILNMTYERAKQVKAYLEDKYDKASKAMKKYKKNEYGITLYTEKQTNQYKLDSIRMDTAFCQLRDFNAAFVKKFKAEIRKDRAEASAKRLEKINQENQK